MIPADLLGRCDFGDGAAPLQLAVSGGADSVAMALLAHAAGRDAVVWHVDHGLRETSAAEADGVAALAGTLGWAFELRRVELDPGPDLEARARAARYGALPPDVCVGHTADDRAETVLLNLARGAGLGGVAAPMDRVRRPILRLRRAETDAVCRAAGRSVAADPMNADPAFTRVAMRLEVMPALAAAIGRDPVPLLNRHADLAADALAVIRAAADALDPTDTAVLRDARGRWRPGVAGVDPP
ncbi:MAG: tRNA lysidine(34) synthetase TilS [Acidimicrobiales bacterium]